MGPNPAAAQPFLFRPLPPQLLFDGQSPWLLRFFGIEATARFVLEFQLLVPGTQVRLPAASDRFQAPQGPLAPAVNARAHQGHLHIKGIEQRVPLARAVLPCRRQSWLRWRSRRL